MIVIADTSPISYLILIGETEILPRLYGEILIPHAVLDELTAFDAPQKVFDWCDSLPDWLVVKDLSFGVNLQFSLPLDKGESEAIQLATDLRADWILIDENAGRTVASEKGFNVIGVIGVLARASRKGWIDPEVVAAKLDATNFFVSKNLIEFLKGSKPE